MKNGLKNGLIDSIKYDIHAFGNTLRDAKQISKIVNSNTYYPEQERKGKIRRCIDLITWLISKHEANKFYNLYGFDIKGTSKDNFLDYYDFMLQRNKINSLDKGYSHAVLLKDKRLFSLYMDVLSLPIPKTVCYARSDGSNVELFDASGVRTTVGEEDCNCTLFAKGLLGECADSVFKIKIKDGCVSSKLKVGEYLIQRALVQHPDMNLMGPESINTIRIVTCMRDGIPQLFSSVLRCGTSQSGFVDNWAAGGLSVGINQDGTLRQYGFYKPGFGGKADTHPDTGVRFGGFQIPFYKEAVSLSLKAQSQFPDCHAIGWDVAITSDGPVFIEGNDNWEITLMQVCNGGLKEQWDELCNSLNKEMER